jgi:WD40 repeat protein
MKYWAFISYSHTDKTWGDWLHKALETYRVPRRLVGKEGRDCKVPARIFPIFRDREELPVSSDLSANINQALNESRYLIVICSPRSAQSRWVGEEIKTFKRLGREDHILALIVEGSPNATDGKPNVGLDQECFHVAMRYHMVDGELSEIRTEPVAGDARQGRDGKSNAKLKLVAGLIGVNYDELKQREQERRLKRVQIVSALSIVLIGLFAALSGALFLKQREARAQQAAAEKARVDADYQRAAAEKSEREARAQQAAAEKARADADYQRAAAEKSGNEAVRALSEAQLAASRSHFFQAGRLISEGHTSEALARLARSIRLDPRNVAALCRLSTLLLYHDFGLLMSQVKLPSPIVTADVEWRGALSPDGTLLATLCPGSIRVWEVDTGKEVLPPIAGAGYAQFSADSTRLITCGADHFARIYNLKPGEGTGRSLFHGGDSLIAAFNPTGSQIATASADKTARIWDQNTGAPVTPPLKHDGAIRSLEFSPDGRQLLTGSADKKARIWDVQTGRLLSSLKTRSEVFRARWSPNGKWIITQTLRDAQLWDAKNAKPVSDPLQQGKLVEYAEFASDSRKLATASENTVQVWDVERHRLAVPPLQHEDAVHWLQFSPDNKKIVTACMNRTAKVWDVETGKPVFDPLKHDSGVFLVGFRNQGTQVVTATMENTCQVWEARSGQALSQRLYTAAVNPASRSPLQFGPDGSALVMACADNSARIFDADVGSQRGTPLTHNKSVLFVRFSPDGKKVVTTSNDGTARVWDAISGTAVSPPLNNIRPVWCADFSRDGERVITGTGVLSGGVAAVWNVQNGEPLVGPLEHKGAIRSVHFSHDDRLLLTASRDRTAAIWDANTGMRSLPPFTHLAGIETAEFSPDDRKAVTGSLDATARIWDVQTGKPLVEPMKHDEQRGNGYIHAAQFSPDGKKILTDSWDMTAQLWNAENGTRLLAPLQHDAAVNSANFSRDGQRICTAAGNSCQVWDTELALPLCAPLVHTENVVYADFSPDGCRLATLAGTNVRVWDVSPSGADWPPWLPELADAVAGEHVDEHDVIQPLPRSSADTFKQIRAETVQDSSARGWAALARWFLGDRSTRTISPFCKLRLSEYVDLCIIENTKQSLAEAMLLGSAEAKGRLNALNRAVAQAPAVGQQERIQQNQPPAPTQSPSSATTTASPNPKKDAFVTVRVKKFNVVIRLPTDLFPDAATKFSDPSLNLWFSSNNAVSLHFAVFAGPLERAYNQCQVEYMKNVEKKQIATKELRDDHFSITGTFLGGEFYAKGVTQGEDILILLLENRYGIADPAKLVEIEDSFTGTWH